MRKVGGTILASMVLMIAGLLIAPFTLDLRPVLPDVGAMLSEEFDQEIIVSGPIGLDLAKAPGIWLTFESVGINDRKPLTETVAPYAAQIGKMRALVRLKPLLHRRIEVETLELIDTDLSLVPSRDMNVVDRAPSSGFKLAGPEPFRMSALNRLRLIGGQIELINAATPVFTMVLSDATATPGEIGLNLEAMGFIEGQEVHFTGRSGPVSAFLSGHRVFIDGTFQSGTANLNVSGSFGELESVGLDLLAEGDAPQLADVAILLGITDLQQNVPTTLTANISGTRSHFVIEDLYAGIGRGDVNGRIEIKRDESLTITGALRSELLDLDAFEGARLRRKPKKLFSDDPLPIEFLLSSEIELDYYADRILLANGLLNDGQVRIILLDGVLSANPVAVSFLDGAFDASLIVDARLSPKFRLIASLTNFDFGLFLADMNVMDEFQARLDFAADINGEGDTIASMFANADGQTNLIVGSGKLSERAGRFFGGDLMAQLRPLAAQVLEDGTIGDAPREINLNCAVSRFDIKNGFAKSRAFLIQTHNLITTGRGNLNFGTESVDLRLAPRPLNPALLDYASDLRVTGSLTQPYFNLDDRSVSRGIAGALGRFALVREADEDLLPLIDDDAKGENPCISALLGSPELNRGTITIHDDIDERYDFDFKKAK